MTASAVKQSHALTNSFLRQAVHHHRKVSRQGVLERLFTLWFRGWVYNQIWEDPRVDAEAMELGPDSRIVTISSGGCNVLNYLLHNPAQVAAIDLNTCHMSLCRLKMAALSHLPDHDQFYQMFGHGYGDANLRNYETHVAPNLDSATRHYWESSHWPTRRIKVGPKRLDYFRTGFYKGSKLGQLIGLSHFLSRLTGVRYRDILTAQDRTQQERFFEQQIAPFFDYALIKWMARNPMTGFSLGIPPSQYRIMHTESDGMVCAVFRERVRRLVVDFPMSDNYFAWQAFSRSYDHRHRQAIPDYLRAEHFDTLKGRVGRVETHVTTLTEFLRAQPCESFNRFVLLDSQDWMPPQVIAELWEEIARVGQPGTRVIFRTSGTRSPIEDALPEALLRRFVYLPEESAAFHLRDRSAIYGGFHLYVKPE